MKKLSYIFLLMCSSSLLPVVKELSTSEFQLASLQKLQPLSTYCFDNNLPNMNDQDTKTRKFITQVDLGFRKPSTYYSFETNSDTAELKRKLFVPQGGEIYWYFIEHKRRSKNLAN